MATCSNEMSNHDGDDPRSLFHEFKDVNLAILRKIVNGIHWVQIKGKKRDRNFLIRLVNDEMESGTLEDVLHHPRFLEMVDNLMRSNLPNLTSLGSQGVDVLAAFVLHYTSEHDIRLARRVRLWATRIARELVMDETDPFTTSPEQMLVEATRSDPLFWRHYNFKSWTELWRHPSRGDPLSPVNMVSIDCEMVRCKEPGHGRRLCLARVCIVGSNCETLLDELVIPAGRVTDCYTRIHGITEQDLRGATLTEQQVQQRVLELITPGTILVGHGMHADLLRLGIDYKRVIDTAFLFAGLRSKDQLCGLPALCQQVLGFDLREMGLHDCLQDAIAPMRLVNHVLGLLCHNNSDRSRAHGPPDRRRRHLLSSLLGPTFMKLVCQEHSQLMQDHACRRPSTPVHHSHS